MDPADAADTIQEAAEEEERGAAERFRRRAAIAIGVLAMLLAITTVGGDNAATELVDANILATDTWAFYQARNIRQTSTQLAADDLEMLLLSQPSLSSDARTEAQRRIESYRATVAQWESDPEGGEGKKELMEKARALEEQREHARRQDPNFDYSAAFYQIAIVLASVSIVALSRPLLWIGLGLGVIATVLMVNGFFLFFDLPIG
jgi:hypothetical protein